MRPARYTGPRRIGWTGLNLTKLESRPRRQVPWEYIFYVDFEGHQDDPCLPGR